MRRLLGYARPYWKIWLLAVLSMTAYASLSPAVAKLLQPLIDGSFVHDDSEVLRRAPFILVGLSVVRAVAAFGSDYGSGWVERRITADLRRDLFTQFLELPCQAFDATSSGQLLSKLLYHTEQVGESLNKGVVAIFKDGMTAVGLIALMVYENPLLSVALLVLGPPMVIGIRRISRRFRRISRRVQETMGNVGHVAQEAVEGQRIVKVFNGQTYEAERFYQENETNLRQHATLIATDAAAGAVLQIMFIGGLAAVLYVISLDEVRNSFTPGSLVAFMAAMAMLMAPIKRASNLAALLQRGVAAAESIFAVLDQPWERDSGSTELKTVEGRIEFRRVSLTYGTNSEPALDGIGLNIEPGQTIALVGASGSGKTSLIRLLPRLYEASGGEIRLDGHRITELTLHNLRGHIAYVGQEVVLFNDTVANNIAYGSQQRVDPTRLREVAATARALEFIEALPKGFETVVGQQGVVLSGGQRQRLAIARALLKDAPVLILDEATSALDAESEHLIQAALETLRKNRTTLVVAHRLSTIRNADRIIVMAQGRIIDQGTHDELLQKSPGYRELHRLHFQTGGDGLQSLAD